MRPTHRTRRCETMPSMRHQEREDPVMTSAQREALDELIPPSQQTGDLRADLITAAQETWRRRGRNSMLGGLVLHALYEDAQSWRTVEYLTGIPRMTARRWATPPQKAEPDAQDQ
ncbi:hypothetical protein Ae717Ps2_6724 [Pseudonocardia sp. Ae717_Ps2]|nr:hypothetical protein Ae717Ps2_6646 [Pseudonocardia sp. Ae717_Ps2]OLM28167.1 hypothetical protein Ae717Ps2_6654 [Pseudonocardia sp. Ae717_Ps2]OLM28188.1 hypothetical protein Ae717Ps2_6675 [Pseudonocardia sp. Ae717_Ps2]OLM28195.1 hypothetical protein Ae717Ps2_6682 [Pseudonocardia sp. Ae717_Ps2]OLM28202.1 hypothetical protein Ae717Ps2_6689 [Pseudonocardia sp. Ae717_Ps2]